MNDVRQRDLLFGSLARKAETLVATDVGKGAHRRTGGAAPLCCPETFPPIWCGNSAKYLTARRWLGPQPKLNAVLAGLRWKSGEVFSIVVALASSKALH
jgi:hypothetical protein